MKKRFSLLIFSALAVISLLVIMPSCEGPQGEPGVAGIDGTDGTDGVDANSFCVECHTVANKTAIRTQWAEYSSHGPKNGSINRGTSAGCAKCHSMQGYLETNMTGMDETVIPIGGAKVFECEMCHDFHGTLAEDEFPDYALRHVEPVSLMYNGHQSEVDLAGSGNLCAYCHQPRPREGFPLVVNSDSMINVNSGHWGTHYGTASVILAGHDAFEVPGSMAYESSGHTTLVGCSDCHMYKNEARMDVGGHTWKLSAESDGYQNIDACKACHAGATSFDLDGKQTEITELIHHLDQLCMDLKLTDDTGHAIPWSSETGLGRMWTSNEAGAVFNLLLAHYEGSHGVHNYKYTKALLTNTIEMVEKW